MSKLTAGILKEIVEKLPEDYLVEFKDGKTNSYLLSDDIGIKISEKRLILTKY